MARGENALKVEADMDFKRLNYFARVAEAGSLSSAAEKILISQPSLSRQMRLLEEELGVTLFRRHRKGMRLTPEGEELYQRIGGPISEIEHALKDIRLLANSTRANLVIALCPSVAHLLAVPLGQRVARDAPHISLRIVEAFAGNTARALHSGEIDIAMIYGPPSSWSAMAWGHLIADMPVEDLLTERLVLIGSADSDLDPDTPVSLKQLATMKLALSERRNQFHGMRRLIDSIEKESRVPLEYIRSDSFQIIKSIVASGEAFSFMAPSSVMDEINNGTFKFTHLDGYDLDRQLMLVTNPSTNHPRAAQKLVSIVKEEISSLFGSRNYFAR